MADEHWLSALIKVPARFGRKLIDIAYVCAHWSEIERELKRREDLARYVEEEKDKRLQYEREARERMEAEYAEVLEKIVEQRDTLGSISDRALQVAELLNKRLGQAVIACAFAIFPHDLKYKEFILRIAGPLRDRLERETHELDKSFESAKAKDVEKAQTLGQLLGPQPPPLSPPAGERPSPPEEEDEG